MFALFCSVPFRVTVLQRSQHLILWHSCPCLFASAFFAVHCVAEESAPDPPDTAAHVCSCAPCKAHPRVHSVTEESALLNPLTQLPLLLTPVAAFFAVTVLQRSRLWILSQ
jgi:hypothetical protein